MALHGAVPCGRYDRARVLLNRSGPEMIDDMSVGGKRLDSVGSLKKGRQRQRTAGPIRPGHYPYTRSEGNRAATMTSRHCVAVGGHSSSFRGFATGWQTRRQRRDVSALPSYARAAEATSQNFVSNPSGGDASWRRTSTRHSVHLRFGEVSGRDVFRFSVGKSACARHLVIATA